MPRLLDLFCGAGGAAAGYARAGFDVVGIDIKPQPRYPYDFIQLDALDALDALLPDGRGGSWCIDDFDAIHASPPCQAYSVLRRANPGTEYPDLVAPTREVLKASGLPWVMENVPGAPLAPAVVLCGSMFGLGSGERQLRRHRLFESNVPMMQSSCQHRGEAIGVYGHGDGRHTYENRCRDDPTARRGGFSGSHAEAAEAMDVDWMSRAEITQAIPPAYTAHIGGFLLAEIKQRALLAYDPC